MDVYVINPLSDARWERLTNSHPHASVFHRQAWLAALARTYGYKPFALTTSAPGEPLREGLVFCEVSSWLTGKRAVSLPFADHCEPLLDGPESEAAFAQWLRSECEARHWRYVELRPAGNKLSLADGWRVGGSEYFFHTLDLSPSLEELFRGFHKDSMQRRIRHAEKEKLVCETGRSPELLNGFYRLMVKTRQRHKLIPQPLSWFRNLVDCLGDALEVRVARKEGRAVAAMIVLRHRNTITYKYGCSDERFHNLGGMPFLFWRLIEDGKSSGAALLDLGRSDQDNPGLVRFKDHFGTTKACLRYLRYVRVPESRQRSGWSVRAARELFAHLPDRALPWAGQALYRHLG